MTTSMHTHIPSVQQHIQCLQAIAGSAQACKRGDAYAIYEWGEAVAYHLSHEKKGTLSSGPNLYSLSNGEPTTTRSHVCEGIAMFFDTVAMQLKKLPWPYTNQGIPKHPALDALMVVLDALEEQVAPSPSMNDVFDTLHWEPEELLGVLYSTQREQRSALGTAGNAWQNLPFWRFNAQMGVQAIASDWTPPKNSFSDRMWYTTPIASFADKEQAVAVLARKMPWSFGAALEYYKEEPPENVSFKMVEHIFAMDFAQANAQLSTYVLLDLMYEHIQYNAHSDAVACFQAKDLGLFLAFELEASSYKSVKDVERGAPVFAAVWQHALNPKAQECLNLPEGFDFLPCPGLVK